MTSKMGFTRPNQIILLHNRRHALKLKMEFANDGEVEITLPFQVFSIIE